MAPFIAWWNTLDAASQAAIAGVVAGAILWLVQKVWTHCPWAPGSPDSATWKQRAASVILAIMAGFAQAGGDLKAGIIAALAALGTSQTIHLWTKAKAPSIDDA